LKTVLMGMMKKLCLILKCYFWWLLEKSMNEDMFLLGFNVLRKKDILILD